VENNGKWLKGWCQFSKSRNLHQLFQRLRAFTAGADAKSPVGRSFNRCNPVKGGADPTKMEIRTTALVTSRPKHK
jgi:hypothetical protein